MIQQSLATATQVTTWFDVFHNAGFSSVTGGATGDFAVYRCGDASHHGATLDLQSINADSSFVECWGVYLRSDFVDYR